MKPATQSLSTTHPLPPCPTTHRPLGDMFRVQTDPLDYLLKLGIENDGLARFRAGFWDVYLIAHPDAISSMLREHYGSYSKNTFTYKMVRSVSGEGLLTLDGDRWHERRRMLQPIFSKERIASLDSVVTVATHRMLNGWDKYADSGKSINLTDQINELTLAIAAQAFFNVDIRESAELRKAINDLSIAFTDRVRSKWFAMMALLGQLSPKNRSVNDARAVIDGVTQRIIRELRKQNPSHESLLVQLAQAQDPETGNGLTEQELNSEVSTLLLAGYETTARALTWCLYLLSRHTEIAQKATVEATTLLAGHQPSSSDIEKLTYNHWLIQETLRLYPSIYAFSRRAEEEEIIESYRIPKGARILISPYVAHRLPNYWPNPDEFRPERFSPEESQVRPTHAYIPFGAGPRQCIGRRFAMLELRLIVPMILQRFNLASELKIPVSPAPLGTLTPMEQIHVNLTRR